MSGQHEWIKSNVGHGESMCRWCRITNREAAVLGMLNECDEAPATESVDDLRHQLAEARNMIDVLRDERLRDENLALQECEWKKRAEAAGRELKRLRTTITQSEFLLARRAIDMSLKLAEAQAREAVLREALRIVNGRIQQARAGRLMTAAEVAYDDETHRIIGDALAAMEEKPR